MINRSLPISSNSRDIAFFFWFGKSRWVATRHAITRRVQYEYKSLEIIGPLWHYCSIEKLDQEARRFLRFCTRYEIACLEYMETQHDAAVAAAAGSILPWYTCGRLENVAASPFPLCSTIFLFFLAISTLYSLALSGYVVRHVRRWRGLQRGPWLMEPEQFRDRDSHAHHTSTSFQDVASTAHEILKMTSTRAFFVNPSLSRTDKKSSRIVGIVVQVTTVRHRAQAIIRKEYFIISGNSITIVMIVVQSVLQSTSLESKTEYC